MASFEIDTDLDLLVAQGFDRESARNALATTRGDIVDAKKILSGTTKAGEDTSAWRSEYRGDFEAGVVDNKQSLGAENRALVKTPLYLSVGSSVVRDEITFYQINVIIKTGQRYARLRRFSQFSAFRSSLPFGTCNSFQSSFPMKGPAFLFGDQTEARRAALDEWIRELSLNESCMNSKEVTASLYDFVGFDPSRSTAIPESEDKHSIGAGVMNQYASLGYSSGNGTKKEESRQPTSTGTAPAPLVFSTASEKATASLKNFSTVPKLDPNPCPMKDIHARLPFKTPISPSALDESNKKRSVDDSREQLMKDLQRDRLVVNKKRISGCDVTLEEITLAISGTINEVLSGDRRPPLSESPSTAQFCENLLRQISRTSSAYLTHLTFTSIIMEDADSPIAVVPESTLAEPLKIVISLRKKVESSKLGEGDYAVQCELEGSTVFRINDPLTDNLDTLLQVKCTYRTTTFGMPKLVNGGVEIEAKEGKAWVLCERATKTTSKDWR